MGPASAWGQDPSSFLAPERVKEVAHSLAWRKLLHYRKPFLRSERSDIDDPSFFFSPVGKHDPEAELRASVAMFVTPEKANRPYAPVNQPAFCAFPARREFLKNAFGPEFESRLPKIDCKDFDTWSTGIAARGASVVFSSAYPNNPASMFGHTFLRLDRKPRETGVNAAAISKQMDLLSYGVNFSATIEPDENPVKFALFGLLGGYTGRYDLSPYYRKVNEYAFSESRDLWEYSLALSEAEVAQLVRHVWELYAHGSLDYYFLDENCSFQILTALEAVKPEWDFSSGFILSAIPVDTIKHITRVPGAVTQVDYRPSLRNEMSHALSLLSDSERTQVSRVFREEEKISPEVSTGALDAVISALSYEKERVSGKNPARVALLRETLLERSRRGKIDVPAVPVPTSERPDFSHGSSRISIAGGTNAGEGIADISLYGFRHDLLDRTPSYNLFSEIRVLGFRGRYREADRFQFEEADLLGMASLGPDSIFSAQKSYKVAARWSRLQEPGFERAGIWLGEGGYGKGWNFFQTRNLVYALASAQLELSGVFQRNFRFSPGADLGLVLNPGRFSLHARVLPLWDATAAFSERRLRLKTELSQAYAVTSQFDLRVVGMISSTQTGSREWIPELTGQAAYRF